MGESYKSLDAWQRSIDLTVAVYKLTAAFPDSERFGLINQLRRAAVSVPSNIAEGFGRASTGEYLQFLGHSRGSNSEVETQLVIARALGFAKPEDYKQAEHLCSEVGRMLNAMMKTLRSRQRGSVSSP